MYNLGGNPGVQGAARVAVIIRRRGMTVGQFCMYYRVHVRCKLQYHAPTQRQNAEGGGKSDGASTLLFQKLGRFASAKPALRACRNHESKQRRIWACIEYMDKLFNTTRYA